MAQYVAVSAWRGEISSNGGSSAQLMAIVAANKQNGVVAHGIAHGGSLASGVSA